MDNLQQPEVMSQQHPELENNGFPQKKSPVTKIIVIVIGVLLLGGVAYGAWWGYSKYFGDIEKKEAVNLNINKELPFEPSQKINEDDFDGNINLEPVYLSEEGKLAEGRDAKRLADIKQIQTALELYYVDQDKFPVAGDSIVLGSKNAEKLCSDGFVDEENICKPVFYMKAVPANPLPNGSDYIYFSEDGATYRIDFVLETSNDFMLGHTMKYFKAGSVYATESGVFQEAEKLTAEEIEAREIEAEEKRQNNKDAARVSDIKQIQTALELYYAGQNHYPLVDNRVILGEGNFKVLCDMGFQKDEIGCTEIYFSKILANPVPGGSSYLYESVTVKGGNEYRLNFALENDVGGLKAGSLLATPAGIKNEELDISLDSDNDELSNNDEIFIWKTDPYKADTDGDSYLDGDEVINGYDPLIAGSARLEDR